MEEKEKDEGRRETEPARGVGEEGPRDQDMEKSSARHAQWQLNWRFGFACTAWQTDATPAGARESGRDHTRLGLAAAGWSGQA